MRLNVAEWISVPNSWQPHCYYCKHAQYTEQLKMDYPPGGIGSKKLYTRWPVGKCALHNEYAFNVLDCEEFEARDGYQHWSYHPKYR